ncbi:hypothetical protein B0H13DRAFT_2657905 [Mycena leptocephala]|nr:hypothetical protein B0H13DRAFT_2657905 [Mycena leptocephala]
MFVSRILIILAAVAIELATSTKRADSNFQCVQAFSTQNEVTANAVGTTLPDCTGKLENSPLSPSECTEIFNVLDQKLAIIDLLTQIGNGKAEFDRQFSYLAIE